MRKYKYQPIMFGPKTYSSLANKLMDLADTIDKEGIYKAVTKFIPTKPEEWILDSAWNDYYWELNDSFPRTVYSNKCQVVASAIYSEGAIF